MTSTTTSGGTLAGGGGQSHDCHVCQRTQANQPGAVAPRSPPGVETTATVSSSGTAGDAILDVLTLGEMDPDDAVLVWSALNTLLFAIIVYLEVRQQ